METKTIFNKGHYVHVVYDNGKEIFRTKFPAVAEGFIVGWMTAKGITINS